MVAKLKPDQDTQHNVEQLIARHREVVRAYQQAHPNFEAEFDEFVVRTFDPKVVLAYFDETDSDGEREDDELNGW